jgi:hypothetical protein
MTPLMRGMVGWIIAAPFRSVLSLGAWFASFALPGVWPPGKPARVQAAAERLVPPYPGATLLGYRYYPFFASPNRHWVSCSVRVEPGSRDAGGRARASRARKVR